MAATPVASVAHESGVASWGTFAGDVPQTCRASDGGFDVQGMLHLRLPAPGLFLSIQAQDFIEDPATCQAKCRTKDS